MDAFVLPSFRSSQLVICGSVWVPSLQFTRSEFQCWSAGLENHSPNGMTMKAKAIPGAP